MDTADPPNAEDIPAAERLRGIILCDCVRTALTRIRLCEEELARAASDLQQVLDEYGCRGR